MSQNIENINASHDSLDLISLEKFKEKVDTLINDIESGVIKANPLSSVPINNEHLKTLASQNENKLIEPENNSETPVETTKIVENTAPKIESLVDNSNIPDDVIIVNGVRFNASEELYGITQKDMGIRLVICNKAGKTIQFMSAATAATLIGLHPTTVRTRMNQKYVDEYGNTWSRLDVAPIKPATVSINDNKEEVTQSNTYPNNSFVYADPEGGVPGTPKTEI